MAKHLNAGKAAANGLLAAELAAVGFTAAEDALEGDQGFVRTHGDIDDFDLGPAPTRRSATATRSRSSCSSRTPRAAAPTRRSTRSPGRSATAPIDLAEIERVDVTVAADLLDMCGIPEPQTGLEGKFSLRHAAALALRRASTGPSGFTDEAVARSGEPRGPGSRAHHRLAPAGRRRAGRGRTCGCGTVSSARPA